MDKYFKALVYKYMTGWYRTAPEYSDANVRNFLDNLPEGHNWWAQWFSNCRGFHESPCEECELKFKCYTTHWAKI